ncbi:DUF1007 family protein [Hoeflea olei]|uniref:ABC transporter substrate-binding protein n=1 Tax=Hoeflea olei TaxID=1480615 RepID=A0A1C1Z157_9HYPH|nr:DUF1007 family protein [Hoeflea olei]OCW59417.1 ABC transporter substrate-binding protein [Hoeflea olei]
MLPPPLRRLSAAAALGFVLAPASAFAHPHVFADARLEIETAADGSITELRNVWRFDEVFSASVVMDFDENADMQLEPGELAKISDMVTQSLAEFDYYTNITHNGDDVAVKLPEAIKVDFQDGQLLMFFALIPDKTELKGKITVGVFDPTMYAALDFIEDSDMAVTGAASDRCTRKVVRPDFDQIIAENQASLTEAFFETTQSSDLSKLLATRLELTCK